MSAIDATVYPTRPDCFGEDPRNATCSTPSQSMIDFLNITNAEMYKQVYCLNPPRDSCAFGYCPNPDIASLAVRLSTYTSTVCLSILILYSPDSLLQSFYAQLLQIYSLMFAALISISLRQLTRLHAVFALTAAGSPLSLYLLTTALRSVFTSHELRLDTVFGRTRGGPMVLFNRFAVLFGLPTWCIILAFIALPSSSGWFQQPACDELFQNNTVREFYYGPIAVLSQRSLRTRLLTLIPFGAVIIAWTVALLLQRKRISQKSDVFVVRRAWRVVTESYPFLRFCTLIAFPFMLWLSMLESGAYFANERFSPTYGQILAIAAATPPLVQCIGLTPRFGAWFVNLTWVRFLVRLSSLRMGEGSDKDEPDSSGSKLQMLESSNLSFEYTPWSYSKLDEAITDSPEYNNVRPGLHRNFTSSIYSISSGSTAVSRYDTPFDRPHYKESGMGGTQPEDTTFFESSSTPLQTPARTFLFSSSPPDAERDSTEFKVVDPFEKPGGVRRE